MLIQPVPATIYLDTSGVIAAMFEEHVHFSVSSGLFRQLAAAGTHIYVSEILWLELAQALTLLPRDPALSPVLRRTYRLRRWDTEVSVRDRWLGAGLRRFNDVMGQFAAVTAVPFSRALWESSLPLMARHQLRSHDARHVATALASGVGQFATFDAHFRRVLDLRLWLI